MSRLTFLLASGFGLGLAPVAPGTFGSLAGIPLYLAILHVTTAPVPTLLLVGLAILLACWVAREAERAIGEHDSGQIVIDEIVGMLVALLWIPPTLEAVVGTFLVFRVLDILKPWPANLIDRRVPGGAGIVLDDVVSGVYANLLMRLVV